MAPPPELYWPPNHDIAEVAVVFGKPFREFKFQPKNYTWIDMRQIYSFLWAVDIHCSVDAISLEWRGWDCAYA